MDCGCSLEFESTVHFFLDCHNHITLSESLFREISNAVPSILTRLGEIICEMGLYKDAKSRENLIQVIDFNVKKIFGIHFSYNKKLDQEKKF